MNAGNRIDKVVSENIRRLRLEREPRKWSRTQLADEFNKYSPPGSRKWNEWRVIDLEVGRSGKPPSAVLWHELVTLCVVFDVVLWDLVLPADDQEVVVSGRSRHADGWSVAQSTLFDAGDLAATLSGIPRKYLADRSKRAQFTEQFNARNVSLAQIIDNQRDLQKTIDQFVASTTFVEVDRDFGDEPRPEVGMNDS